MTHGPTTSDPAPHRASPVTRRHVVRSGLVAAGAVVAAPFINLGRFRLFAAAPEEYSARCLKLMLESTVLDMLSPLSIDDRWLGWAKDPESFTETDFQKYRSSGIDVFHAAVGLGGPNAYEQAVNYFGAMNALIAGADRRFTRIKSAADLSRIHTAGKIGLLPGLQNSEHFRRPADVDFFFTLGQRVSQLTYNSRNLIGNGSTERRDEGISDFGAAIVTQMNTTGMAIDVSHCGDRTTLDAFELSTKPVLITHSNVRALAGNHPRCKSDDAIRAVGKAGSVMGISGVRMFVKATEPTTIEDVLDHFDYVRKMIGSEHLGVGSDMDLDGYDKLDPKMQERLRASYKSSYAFRDRIDIAGLDHPKRMFDLTEGLIRRRYSNSEIHGVLGGNFIRVLTEIWPARRAG